MAAYTSTGLVDTTATPPELDLVDLVDGASVFVEAEGDLEEAARSALLVHPEATTGIAAIDETERIP